MFTPIPCQLYFISKIWIHCVLNTLFLFLLCILLKKDLNKYNVSNSRSEVGQRCQQGIIIIIEFKIGDGSFGFDKFNHIFSRSVKVNTFGLSSIGGLDFFLVNWFQSLRLVKRFDLFFVERTNNFLLLGWRQFYLVQRLNFFFVDWDDLFFVNPFDFFVSIIGF